MTETSQTITEMINSLPLAIQERILEDVQEIVADAIDESDWQIKFERKQEKLMMAARRVRRQVAAGKAKPIDHSKL
jgi:hypothetical protein